MKQDVTAVQSGKWEAKLGQSRGRKHSYIGLFDTAEQAAKAYDNASVNRFGPSVATNFDLNDVSA